MFNFSNLSGFHFSTQERVQRGTIGFGFTSDLPPSPPPRGEHFRVKGYWGCADGWGHISTTRLTIMGSPSLAVSGLCFY